MFSRLECIYDLLVWVCTLSFLPCVYTVALCHSEKIIGSNGKLDMGQPAFPLPSHFQILHSLLCIQYLRIKIHPVVYFLSLFASTLQSPPPHPIQQCLI
ncbi:hypothetical protein XELAEV_18046495mg [Xenopus laevis]|uniref:Uncharacterized protein n=1 Tax=Xenopus laevis TaxID=8355 RepID=A0A974H0M1_XENLA|nr:hypothetical protein XELAEV_18046495mg [Xenopus laevis]